MRLLLDTHSFIWFLGGELNLPKFTRELISDIQNQVFVSVASLWEIAIKTSLGKLTLGCPFEDLIPEQLKLNAIDLIPIGLDDLSLVATLPFHHRDPFDRLIIAQALKRDLPIVGKDSQFSKYSVKMIWEGFVGYQEGDKGK